MASIMDTFREAIKDAIIKMYIAAETDEKRTALLSDVDKVNWTSLIMNQFDNFKEQIFLTLKSTMFEQAHMKMHRDAEFMSRLHQTWFRAFAASEAMYVLVLETVSNYDTRISTLSKESRADKANRYFALKYIHGRVLQQFLEAITLIKNGLADGAYSRWRSMYELGIVAQFIFEETEEVAAAYINSSETDNRYDWAKTSKVLKDIKKPHFSDIERASTFPIQLWKDQYSLACSIIHPSSKGTFGRIAHPEEGQTPYVSVGRSNYGMTEPGECTAITLSQVTAILMSVYELDEEETMALDCIVRWVDFLKAEYFQAHDDAFPDCNPLMSLLIDKKKKSSL